MSIVINIGMNREGQFDNSRWHALLKWLSGVCDSVRLYTHFRRDSVDTCFSDGWVIEEEAFPDPSSDLRGFRLWGKGRELWQILERVPFDPEDGITHCYFLNGDMYIGDLEVNDGENFVICHLTIMQESQLERIIPSVSSNIETCTEWADAVSDLVGNEKWKHLGAD